MMIFHTVYRIISLIISRGHHRGVRGVKIVNVSLIGFKIGVFKEKATKCITYYGDKVRQGDTIKIRILFLKELEPVNFPTVSCCIAYKSFNKKYWRQNFYVPSKTLEESILITEKEYNELTTRVE